MKISPTAAQVLAIFPVFWGISGSTSTTLIAIVFLPFQFICYFFRQTFAPNIKQSTAELVFSKLCYALF